MDDFDDLLAPSKQALEENPFANSYTNRSSSPDPWASPFRTGETSNAFAVDPAHSDGFSAADIHHHHHHHDASGALQRTEFSTAAAPLGLPSHDDGDDNDRKPLGQRLVPGFRESVVLSSGDEASLHKSTEDDESVALSPPSTPKPDQRSIPGRQATPPTDVAHVRQPSHTSSGAAISASLPILDPGPDDGQLKIPSTTAGLDASIANMTLGGGESDGLGGWQNDEQAATPWSTEEETMQFAAAPNVEDDDDSDDDKPLRSANRPSAQTSGAQWTPRKANGVPPVCVISVEDPQKVGDPIRSFTMYTVHTRTSSPLFQKSAFSVLRRYSDFLWLYETLSANNPGVVVPPVPEKNSFGRFGQRFVRQRRVALEKCIQKMANHPVLGKDADLVMFLESDSFALDIKHRKAEIANERGGLIASIGQTITGPRFHETDEWFDRQKGYLDSLESQLRGLAKTIELVAKQRLDLSVAALEFANGIAELSSSDIDAQLAQTLAVFADVERKVHSLQSTQSEQDMVTLMATVDEYARLINSVRLAFTSRIRVYHTWKNAESDLLRTKQSHEKNRSQGRIPPERLGHSLNQIAEAERRALDAKREFDHVSKLVKTELARFEQERLEDFKDTLHVFLEGMISRQKELISAWENYQHLLLKRVGGEGTTAQAASSVVA